MKMNKKKGVALLLALLTLIIISLLMVAFLEVTTIDLQITSNHFNRNKALYIADAGVEYAVWRLKSSKANSSQLMEFPLGSGNTYNVTYNSVSATLTSVGRLISGEQVTVEAKVSVTGSAPYTVKIIYWREP